MMTKPEISSDDRLVELSREGDREAFARIVEKYQTLICGLTYSACGNIQASEDLAQVTFITAWCQLRHLREPGKLKSWLCSIARNVTVDSFRKQQRTPTANAVVLDGDEDILSEAPTPSDHAISKEEEAILWRSLGELAPTYREPLVLFYRQNQSVADVARSLDLSEDVVRQRLSRGRTMLSEQVSRLVETTLRSSGPTRAFTVGVLAALPVFATSAKAATVGATAATGSAAVKGVAFVGLAGAILGPIVGLLGGWLGAKLAIENTESAREREFMIKMSRVTWVIVGPFCLAILACAFGARFWWKAHPALVAVAIIGTMLGYGIILAVLIVWGNRAQRRIRREEAGKLPPGIFSRNKPVCFQPFEYRSRWTLLGLPLIHIKTAGTSPEEKMRHPAMGWIAIGDTAVGVLLAVGGGAAVGLFAIGGGAAAGLFAIGGGCAVGLVSLGGGFAFGVWAVGGGLAMGWLAFGGCAFGWTAALGGVAVAHEFARGGLALAPHANDAAVGAFIQNNAFLQHALKVMRHAHWLVLLALIPLGMIPWRMWMNRARAKQPPVGR